DATVDVTFIIDGVGTLFQINRQGFFGMGVGMANKVSSIPNEWLVNCLENVTQVTFDIREGNFSHNQIVSGNENTAALLAIGPAESYTFNFDVADSRILGGGNMVLLTDCLDDMCDDLLRADADFSNMPRDAQTMLAQAQRMMEEATAMMQEAKGLILQK